MAWRAQPVWRSRSRMMLRVRARATAMQYIQKPRDITSIPISIGGAMLGALVRLTEAPWCKVFHQTTEK